MNKQPLVYLDTLGCEKNLVDSEGALGLLLQRGFRLAQRAEDADLIVVNTCGFLASAREESLERLRELGEVKGSAKLVAMGCLVQGETHDLKAEVDQLDHTLGVGQYHRLADLVEGAADEPLVSPDEAPYAGYSARALLSPPHVANLKLAEGCNQSCTFCKIPMLRGRQRSRPIADIVSEATRLAGEGTREFTLIAQNSSAYGIDLPGQPRLGDLCRALAAVDGLEWIRVMYAYPPMFTNRLADDVFSVPEVVSYLDIPIQHASPAVLRRMNRGYDPDRLRVQMEHLRSIRPDVMLRTTAMVGFPGETEDDVVALMDFLAELQFDHLATFTYSHELGTPSYEFEDDVDAEEKEDRRARVENLQWDIALERKTARLGKPELVVVDEVFDGPEEAGLDMVAIETGRDDRSGWRGRVGFGRSAGYCYDVDGGLWFAADDLGPGDRRIMTPMACGPYDSLAQSAPQEGTNA